MKLLTLIVALFLMAQASDEQQGFHIREEDSGNLRSLGLPSKVVRQAEETEVDKLGEEPRNQRSLGVPESQAKWGRQKTAKKANAHLGKEFVFVNKHKNWADAREECKKIGGDMATNLLEKELKFIFKKVITEEWKRGVWVGARMNPRATKANFTKSFEWLDGTRIPADSDLWRWGFAESSAQYSYNIHRCVAVWRTWKRQDEKEGPAYVIKSCEWDEFPVLCEIPKKRHRYVY